jgi:adenylylsulfate kinase
LEKSKNITSHVSKVSTLDRAVLQKQNAATIWLTGLSASGKSTLAYELERQLHDLGHACYVLDGDNIRHGLCRDLGFSPDHRKENIRRIAEVARLFNDAGLVTITAFISPYRDDRAIARDILGPERFLETHVAADIAVCERRDPRGLYRKARTGEIAEFTGVSAPYEAPENPTIRIDTGLLSIEDSMARLLEAVLPRLRHSHRQDSAGIHPSAATQAP